MVVIGYYPATGTIEQILVQADHNRFQITSRRLNWFLTQNWVSKASADLSMKKGFAPLSPPQDYEQFVKSLHGLA